MEMDDNYIGLQAPISISKVAQTSTIIGGIPFMLIDLVDVDTIGMNQDIHESDPQSVDEFDGPNNSNNDG